MIGTKVVCVDDSFPAGINDVYNALPVKDRVYIIRDVVPGWDFKLKEQMAIYLVELVNLPNEHGIEPGFKIDRFREVDEDLEELSTAEEEFLVNMQ